MEKIMHWQQKSQHIGFIKNKKPLEKRPERSMDWAVFLSLNERYFLNIFSLETYVSMPVKILWDI